MKKGFTLVEVLAVIVVLGVIAMIIIPTMINTLNNNKQSAYEMVISDFKAAAQDYINDNRGNITELNSFNTPYDVTLETLDSGGYIELPVLNPKTNTNFPSSFIITVSLLQNGSYAFQTAGTTGNNPTIVLNGSDPDTVACHPSNNYNDPGAEITDSYHENVPTVYSLTTLSLNNAGDYNLPYSYFNEEGGFVNSSRLVTITNTNSPSITIEGGDSIRTVNKGNTFTPPNATASDFCEFNIATSYTSNVDVNTVGTYTVTYSATNSTGHTTTKDLTVEVVSAAPDWLYEKELVIDHTKIDAPITDFPITVFLDNTNFDFSKAKSDGSDIKFVNSMGNTLNFEKDYYDSSGSSTPTTKNIDFDVISDLTNNFTSNMPYGTQTISGGSLYFNNTQVDEPNTIETNFLTNKFIDEFSFDMANEATGSALNYHYPNMKIGIVDSSGNLVDYILFSVIFQYNYSGDYKYNYSGKVIYRQYSLDALTNSIILCDVPTRDINTFHNYSFLDNKDGTVTFKLDGGSAMTINLPNSSYRLGDSINIRPINGWWNDDINAKIDNFNTKYSDSSNSSSGVFHIKIPSISSSSDTSFWMQYGNSSATDNSNPSGVWDSNYVMVNHMGSSILDITTNNNNGTNYGTSIVDGKVGQARNFDGVDDYIDLNNDNLTSLGGTSDGTIVAIINMNLLDTEAHTILNYRGGGFTNSLDFQINSNPGDLTYDVYEPLGWPAQFEDVISINQDFFVSSQMAANGTRVRIKANSASIVFNNPEVYTGSSPTVFSIGRDDYSGNYFNGIIDEIRTSSIERSDAWIDAEYNSLFDYLLTYGTETLR